MASLFEGGLVYELEDLLVNPVVTTPGSRQPELASFHLSVDGQNMYYVALAWAMLGSD